MATPVTTNELVEEGSLPEGLVKQLLSLASKWGETIDMKTLKMVHLSGSTVNNKVYRASWPTKGENVVRTVLVRIYGESVGNFFFNRDQEIQNFASISMLGTGPKLLGQFPEGRIEEFIHARTLSVSDICDPDTSALIAAKLREFHNLDMPGSKKAFVWDNLRKWIAKAISVSTPEHTKKFCLDTIEEEIGILESNLSEGYDQDIRFCHNDLQCGNIMFDEKTRNITIIDYEFASYNPLAYDIANYFCEMAANYLTDTPHILNYNKYPDLEERQRFIRLYLSSTGHQPGDVEVEKLVHDVEKYTLACHLICGLWGIILDSEYASYNPVASDLSGHFFFIGTNMDDTHISINSLYPDSEERRRFVRLYLSSDGNQPSDADVEKLVQDAENYALADHLFGALWGIVTYYEANIDFDCIGYARKKFEQYWLKKPPVLGTTTLIPVNHA